MVRICSEAGKWYRSWRIFPSAHIAAHVPAGLAAQVAAVLLLREFSRHEVPGAPGGCSAGNCAASSSESYELAQRTVWVPAMRPTPSKRWTLLLRLYDLLICRRRLRFQKTQLHALVEITKTNAVLRDPSV